MGASGSLGEGLEVYGLALLLVFTLLPVLPRGKQSPSARASCRHAFPVLMDCVPSNQELK